MLIADPAPATGRVNGSVFLLGPDGATNVCCSTCAFCQAGMSRGRLEGSAKKAKTLVIG